MFSFGAVLFKAIQWLDGEKSCLQAARKKIYFEVGLKISISYEWKSKKE